MSDIAAWIIFAGLIAGLLCLMYGPRRSDIWHAIELWGADNRRAALKRERRRARRKGAEAAVQERVQ